MENSMQPNYDLSGLDPKSKKKQFSSAAVILILLIGFIVLAGAALWVEAQHNQCVVDLSECSEVCKSIPLKDLQGGDWYEKYLTGS